MPEAKIATIEHAAIWEPMWGDTARPWRPVTSVEWSDRSRERVYWPGRYEDPETAARVAKASYERGEHLL